MFVPLCFPKQRALLVSPRRQVRHQVEDLFLGELVQQSLGHHGNRRELAAHDLVLLEDDRLRFDERVFDQLHFRAAFGKDDAGQGLAAIGQDDGGLVLLVDLGGRVQKFLEDISRLELEVQLGEVGSKIIADPI